MAPLLHTIWVTYWDRRINAGGRIGDARLGTELLLTEDENSQAIEIARKVR